MEPARFTEEKAESRVLPDRLFRELPKPLVDKPQSAARDNVLAILGDEASGLAMEAGTEIVMDGLGPLLSRLEVGCGVNVETDDLRL